MSKGNEKNLRRQIEILKAQVRASQGPSGKPILPTTEKTFTQDQKTPTQVAKHTRYDLNYVVIKQELKKTLVFSTVIIISLFILKITYLKWAILLKIM